jgi:hypothetical protein
MSSKEELMTKYIQPVLASGEFAYTASPVADAEPLNRSAIGAVQMAVSETHTVEASYDPERYGVPVTQLADTAPATVTPRDKTAAERMRRMRARRREVATAPAPSSLMFERQDWQLLLDRTTLPQRAGCQPGELGRVVLKELVDNALDTGATVTLDRADRDDAMIAYVIADDGPGIDPVEVPRLFAVNRPFLSSKLKRLPLRGMLGHGLRVVMGAVASLGGHISVASRGHRLTLAVDPVSGITRVVRDQPISPARGTAVTIALPEFNNSEADPARLTIAIARQGEHYTGPSLPQWHSVASLQRLFGAVTPETATVGEMVHAVFGIADDDPRIARSLSCQDIAELHDRLCRGTTGSDAGIGGIGPHSEFGKHYACVTGSVLIEGANIPYCIECWTSCCPMERGNGQAFVDWLLINRSLSLPRIVAYSGAEGLTLDGCGLLRTIPAAKTAGYIIALSLIAPYIRLASDGKTPVLDDFSAPIGEAVRKAAGAAYRAMARPPREISIKDSAWWVMERAYLAASDGGQLPATARQIMYAARPAILEMTGRDKLDDAYFTQTLLPDYMNSHPEADRDWDVVFDARGHFTEPHTERTVPLGTIDVRKYLGERPCLGPAVELVTHESYPTSGPHNRYRNVLFVEKEGFDPLLKAAGIAERFDVAIMSTKGMSTTAARLLLDRLAPEIDRVFVLHDLDVAGFSIFGTLASSGRRYTYQNEVPLIDIGLRLTDALAMDLQAERVTVSDWSPRANTLRRHGATEQEIAFLRRERVELNAMTSREFIEFIEAKFAEYGVAKVLPDAAVMEAHARRLIEQRLAHDALAEIREQLADEAANHVLPDDLGPAVRAHLDAYPSLAWDDALAEVIDQGMR